MSKRLLLVLMLLIAALVACEEDSSSDETSEIDNRPAFRIVSGSENRTLEPIIQEFANDNNVRIEIDYIGSVDISLMLQEGAENMEYDAVWPANSLWIRLGDTDGITRHDESILRSPVVLGVKRNVAEDLGWIGTDVRVQDILEAGQTTDLNLMMTSATQSNSGASAYFGFLYALSGQPEVLTSEILNDPQLGEDIQAILAQIDRSSRSSGFLKDLFLDNYNRFDAMFNYEAVVIEFNQEIETRNRQDGGNREPLYVVYPVDGLSIADSPLAYVERGIEGKEELFLDLQEYLLTEDVQNQLTELGRRTGRFGLSVPNANPAVFNPDWGIDTELTIVPINTPTGPVIREALNLYQTAFRKGSYTVYCLDFSGSMQGTGEAQLDEAMFTLLDSEPSTRYLLQASSKDTTIVIPFNSGLIDVTPETPEIDYFRVEGNDIDELNSLYRNIQVLTSGGGTNMYACALEGLRLIQAEVDFDAQFPAIILMTDGASANPNLGDGGYADFQVLHNEIQLDIPVYSIAFGEADETQLVEIATFTDGDVYDGTENLIDAFRAARGNN